MRGIKVDLERDAFTIDFDGDQLDLTHIIHAIEALGFQPSIAGPDRGTDRPEAKAPAEIPEPIGEALARARATGRHVVVEFYADWCVPCKVLEGEIISAPTVQKALRGFVLIKIDTDQYPDAGRSYDIGVVPTVLVLDARGKELSRITGMIEATALAEQLEGLSRALHESSEVGSDR